MPPTTSRIRADKALSRLAALHPKLIDLGLGRTINLLNKLGDPHRRLPPVIHLAGTNGKGSVIAFLRAMLEASGARVHAYTSPHLVQFNERIRLAGRLIDDDALADLLEETEAANAGEAVTFFELTTAAAMLAFSRQDADVVLLETGLGGRLDSTNVIVRPLASVITPIARDHEHFLGNTITKIAHEKAGIIKPGTPVFSSSQHQDAEKLLQQVADDNKAPISIMGRDMMISRDETDEPSLQIKDKTILLSSPGLIGAHQVENAALAAATINGVFPDCNAAAISDGVSKARWPARIQKLSHGEIVARFPPEIELWLDGAHNGHGASALADALKSLHSNPWVMIGGALNTRPAADFLTPLKPMISHFFTMTIPDQQASLGAEELAATALSLGIPATATSSLDEAIAKATALAKRSASSVIIGGSLYLAGYVLARNGTLPD